MYRSLNIALAAALFAPLTQAMAEIKIEARCEVESAYDLKVEREGLRFSRESGSEIQFTRGRVLLDGNPVNLSGADSARVVEFEREVRAMVPEVKAIAGEAIEVAFVALQRVIESFATEGNREAFVTELAAIRDEISAAVASANSSRGLDEQAIQAKVEKFVARIAPRIAGEFASLAITAALTGDEKSAKDIERRAELFERDIEASVQVPAKLLEARVNALCPRVQALDQLESEMEIRLPNGELLNLMNVDMKA